MDGDVCGCVCGVVGVRVRVVRRRMVFCGCVVESGVGVFI